jgi:hypothetical protein
MSKKKDSKAPVTVDQMPWPAGDAQQSQVRRLLHDVVVAETGFVIDKRRARDFFFRDVIPAGNHVRVVYRPSRDKYEPASYSMVAYPQRGYARLEVYARPDGTIHQGGDSKLPRLFAALVAASEPLPDNTVGSMLNEVEHAEGEEVLAQLAAISPQARALVAEAVRRTAAAYAEADDHPLSLAHQRLVAAEGLAKVKRDGETE